MTVIPIVIGARGTVNKGLLKGLENSEIRRRVENSQGVNNNNNNNLDVIWELKKLWNMKVTIILIVIGAFGTVTKGLLKGLEDLEVSG